MPDQTSDPMAEIRASFFVECDELLEALQDGLQSLDEGDDSAETVNVVFRAVHSIKGGAGAFGLDALVAFAHRFETAMDEVRAGRLIVDSPVLKVFYHAGDILSDLVRAARDDLVPDAVRIDPVLALLDTLAPDPAPTAPDPEIDFQPMGLDLDLGLGDLGNGSPGDGAPLPDDLAGADRNVAAGETTCQITFRPRPEMYALGNEPLFLFNALRDLGPLSVQCDESALPDLAALDPEHGYLGWRLHLVTAEPIIAIREIFEFVDGLCTLDIVQVGETERLPSPHIVESATDEPQGIALDLPRLADLAPPVLPAPAPPVNPAQTQTPDARARSQSRTAPRATVRVDLERIDRLVNLVGEIVINQAMLTQSVDAIGLPPNSPVRTGLEDFLQLTRDIQDSVMMIRAQPVKSLFQRMARIVREAASEIGKDIRLHTDGENTEVDKTVIERLADPLTHMIRNAVDHGLEDTEARLAAGKPAEGNVYLSAAHRSGRIVIGVQDDGGGIDRDKVRRKAMDKGLIPPDAILTDTEIDNLLFSPGFSTADTISNLSGRGVGMDVVRSAIQALGGRITTNSERGKGTMFSISLPLTLAVLDGMIVRVAGETLVVPLAAISETLALSGSHVRAFGPSTNVVSIRDRFVPLLDLGTELGYRGPLADYTGCTVLLISQENGNTVALAVDTIEDQRQVVIKGLQDTFGRVPGIAAATILGDGQIALILDPVDLVTQARGQTRGEIPVPGTAQTSPDTMELSA